METEFYFENDIGVSIIGTGGGYGESVIVNLGNRKWMVVDSCEDPNTKECLPLVFLKKNGIKFSDVKLIVCSHWHDDHIRGISKLYSECIDAIFCVAIPSDKEKFMALVLYDNKKSSINPEIASTKELLKCLEIRNGNRPMWNYLLQDRMIWFQEGFFTSKVYCLSPSDEILNQWNQEIASLIPKYCEWNPKITLSSPNNKSVVLKVIVGNHCFLLGSDLENGRNNSVGWNCILTHSQSAKISPKATLIKIPHHGSRTSYNSQVWCDLLNEKPIGLLTPFFKGSITLPNKDMLQTYLGLTNQLFITSSHLRKKAKPKKRNKLIGNLIRDLNPSVEEIPFVQGVISVKINLDHESDGWQILLEGSAFKVE